MVHELIIKMSRRSEERNKRDILLNAENSFFNDEKNQAVSFKKNTESAGRIKMN